MLAALLVLGGAVAPAVVQASCMVCLAPGAATLQLRRWEPSEVPVEVQIGGANPYDAAQIEVRLRLTGPTGGVMWVPAFPNPDGPAPFRVRFTLSEAGEWRATPQLRRAGGAWRSGVMVRWQVEEAAMSGPFAHGFVRVDAQNRAMLRFDDGASFFPVGANIAWYTNDALKEYERRFDALAAAGGTAARVWLAPWSFLPEWQDTPLRNYANRELRMDWFDAVLRMAEARGIYLIVVLSEAGMFDPAGRWRENPYNRANGGPCAAPHDFLTDPAARAAYANQLRYIAARWGYSPNILAWEWMNEVNSAPGFATDLLLPWLREMSSVLTQYDVHRHLRTISYASVAGDPRIWALPEIELVQRHEYIQGDPTWFRPLPDGQARFQQVAEQQVKPILVAEFGANSDMEHATGAYRQGIQMHNGLWAAAFAGMAGSSMYWWWDNYLEPGRLWWQYSGLTEFLRGEDLGHMTPAAVQVHTAGGPAAVALRLQASANSAGCSRVLVWVRNSAWRHDSALVQYVLARSAGKASAVEFTYRADPSRGVEIDLLGLQPGRYRVAAYATNSGRLLWTRDVVNTGTLHWQVEHIDQDVAFKVDCVGG
ncbi:MAG: DUF5060 domain-containing protein [Chloroflexi bacterium]|nr:DUF5060 domain-containing protein [Chloroflexota bacterium]